MNGSSLATAVPASRTNSPAPSHVDYAELRRLSIEVKRLRADNADLRRRIKENGWAVRIAQQAKDDAMALVADLIQGLDVSRDEMERRRGISRRRWEWSRALLYMARCTNHHYKLIVFDPAVIEAQLEKALRHAADDLDALEARLPPCRVRERQKRRTRSA